MIKKIISGGQTGADRGALDAAIYAGFPHGGTCPYHREAEDGQIPDTYNLTEHPSRDYDPRTKQNVSDSDATLVFTWGDPEGGTLKTIECCHEHHKHKIEIDLKVQEREEAVRMIVSWLEQLALEDIVLNIAGPRESNAPGIQELVAVIMADVLRIIESECSGLPPLPLKKSDRN